MTTISGMREWEGSSSSSSIGTACTEGGLDEAAAKDVPESPAKGNEDSAGIGSSIEDRVPIVDRVEDVGEAGTSVEAGSTTAEKSASSLPFSSKFRLTARGRNLRPDGIGGLR